MDERLVFFKDSIVPVGQAQVHMLSPTAQFAVNVFEGIRGYWNEYEQTTLLFRLNDHLDRLRESCLLMRLVIPFSDVEIRDIIKKTIHANNYRCDIALRLIVFIDGEGSWSSLSSASLIVAPIQMSRVQATDRKPLTVCVSSWRRIDDLSLPPRVKCGANYINGRYAQLDAQDKGFDLPLFLGKDGKLSEAPGSCLFVVRNGKLLTPPSTASILDSITRDTLLKLADQNNISTEIRSIDRTELLIAQEAFLCGSAAEISPIGSVDGAILGDGRVGPITKTISDLYFATVSSAYTNPSDWNWCVETDNHEGMK